jgi:MSHA biogenesis protein MshN
LQRAAPRAADNAQFHGFYAAVLARSARSPEAAAENRAALRLSPGTGVWWMGLGLALEADGRAAEAREAYQRARAGTDLSPDLAAFVDQKLRAK